uniref:Uncharacterized protein n=1 Tax=Timema cristinae TaxID=61476 RepID=A0A7R9GTU9_TIMCR|nr:unnamed protein product [Timema cristinae]
MPSMKKDTSLRKTKAYGKRVSGSIGGILMQKEETGKVSDFCAVAPGFILGPGKDLSDYQTLPSPLTRHLTPCLVMTTNSVFLFTAPERNLELNQIKPDIDSVNISCRAQGVYPEPKMALYKDRDRANGVNIKGVVVESTSKGGEYDIIAYKVIQDEDLQSSTVFDCELRIPEANYVVRKSIVYYTGKETI